MREKAHYPISRWWGWGDSDKSFKLHERSAFFPFLKNAVDVSNLRPCPPPFLSQLSIPESSLSSTVISALHDIFDPEHVSVEREDRVRNSLGRSYRDLLSMRLNRLPALCDAVVFPQTQDQVRRLIALASQKELRLVPVGGATSVVGGVEPVYGAPESSVVAVNLSKMNRILSVDPVSLTVRVQAGAYGRDLEQALNRYGLSLGHFPESFHFSTVGGWIAASSCGQNSTLYGKINDLVMGLTVVTPAGVFSGDEFPAHAQGPDLKSLFLGSEGTLGVITEALLKVHPQPERTDYFGLLFPDFAAGVEASRHIMRRGLTPAVIRLSDGPETDLGLALLPRFSNPLGEIAKQNVFRFLRARGYEAGRRSLMILGFEGRGRVVRAQRKDAARVAGALGALCLGSMVGRQWKKGRFDNPYLRDTLMNMGMLVDTLETVTLWSNMERLYQQVRKAILDGMRETGTPGMVAAHLSHLYPQGSSLYFILLCAQCPDRELEQWRLIKARATNAIMESGGALSHHHGIGLDHREWFRSSLDDTRRRLMEALKTGLDKEDFMNPGKLFS